MADPSPHHPERYYCVVSALRATATLPVRASSVSRFHRYRHRRQQAEFVSSSFPEAGQSDRFPLAAVSRPASIRSQRTGTTHWLWRSGKQHQPLQAPRTRMAAIRAAAAISECCAVPPERSAPARPAAAEAAPSYPPETQTTSPSSTTATTVLILNRCEPQNPTGGNSSARV